ncbi:MAG: hypothetical protein ABIS23_05620, partial [Sphingomicrobium sp.]
MTSDEIGRLFAQAEARFERAAAVSDRTGKAVARADSILSRVGSRDNAERAAARRERRRLNAGLGRALRNAALVVVAVWIVTIVFGFVQPIGLFGLLGAVAAAAVLAGLAIAGTRRSARPAVPSPTLSGPELVDRLDSYLYRARPALPAPAQSEIDGMLAALPTLKPSLETAPALDPAVNDARRLMGTHLPGLIDRYLAVPAPYRSLSEDGEPSVDDRLIEALRAGRGALDDLGGQLARDHVAAFETQGRFIES